MTSESVDFFNNQHYGLIRRLMSYVALWPFEETAKRLPCMFLITILMLISINVQIFVMLTSEQTVNSFTELLQSFLAALFFALTYWNLLYNSALIKEILNHIKNDWNELTREDDLSIMRTYVAQSKLYSQAIICPFSLYTAFLTSPSIISFFLYIFGVIDRTKVTLPVHNEAFVSTKLMYFLMFPLELIIILTIYTVGITYCSMFIYILQHACALFVIVTNEIDRPFMENEYKFDWVQTVTRRESELEWIIAVIQNNDNAIEFVELIRLLFEQLFVLQVLLTACFFITDFICFFQLLNLMISAVEALKILFFMSSTMLMIYIYAYLGERLIEHSASVYAKCRLVPFYTLSIETNKLFLLFIMRSMTPRNISASGIIIASYELLLKAIKVSFSFATVCYNMR